MVSKMNSRERVTAVVEGREADRTPVAFWCHFHEQDRFGEAAVKAHMDFFRESGTDICKVMNENTLPCTYKIDTVGDYAKAAPINMRCKYMQDQVDTVKRIAELVDGQAVVLATIHGVIVSAHHMSGNPGVYVDNRQRFRAYLQENPEALKDGFKRISEGLAELAEACIEAGADGIYYAALGAEKDLFTAEEYERYVEPYEKLVFAAADKGRKYNTLHICKHGLDIARYASYPVSMVNWAIHEDNPTLEEGCRIFRDKVILGGLDDRSGVLVDGTAVEIGAEIGSLLTRMEGRPFVLGTDCTLPTDYSRERLKLAVLACEHYARRD